MSSDTSPKIPNASEVKSVDDRTVCFCQNVPLSQILEAIQKGAATFEQIQEVTLASTGCGSCEFEVRDILEAELSKLLKGGGSGTR